MDYLIKQKDIDELLKEIDKELKPYISSSRKKLKKIHEYWLNNQNNITEEIISQNEINKIYSKKT